MDITAFWSYKMLGMWFSVKWRGTLALFHCVPDTQIVSQEVLPHSPLPSCHCRCPGCLWRFATSPCALPKTLDWALPDSGKSQNQQNGNTGKNTLNMEQRTHNGGWCLIKYSACVTAIWGALLNQIKNLLNSDCSLYPAKQQDTQQLPPLTVVGVQKAPHAASEIAAFYVAQTLGWWRENEVSRSGYDCRGPCGWLTDQEALSLPTHTGGDKLAFLGKELHLSKVGNKNCQ